MYMQIGDPVVCSLASQAGARYENVMNCRGMLPNHRVPRGETHCTDRDMVWSGNT